MAIPFITIELDRPYQLRLGLGASVAFEQMTGKKLMDVADEFVAGDVSMVTIAELLRAMLLRERPDITMADACNLVDDYSDNLASIIAAVINAVAASNADDEADKNHPNAKTPTAKKKTNS